MINGKGQRVEGHSHSMSEKWRVTYGQWAKENLWSMSERQRGLASNDARLFAIDRQRMKRIPIDQKAKGFHVQRQRRRKASWMAVEGGWRGSKSTKEHKSGFIINSERVEGVHD